MTEFQDLKSQWETQPDVDAPTDGSKRILTKINGIKRKQYITNVVLLTTVSVLIYYFFYINAYSNLLVSLGLFLMIGSLLIRVCMEYFSIRKLNKLDVTSEVTKFKSAMTMYYKRRIKTHYIITPIIFILYIVGFLILLPFFKEHLSVGFYTYIKVSGVVIFAILSFFIGYEIKKELKVLKQITE